MKHEVRDETVVALALAELDARSAGIDPVTAVRLSAVRHRALQQRRSGFSFSAGRRFVLAGAAAMVALFLALPLRQGEPAPTLTAQEVEALDIITTQGQMDLLVEDPEFLRWLAEQKQNAG